MLDQAFINWVLSGFGALMGMVLTVIWQSVKELQKTDKSLAEKVGSIEVLVAGQYIKREDFEKVASELFRKCDKILDKLDSKQDKLK